MKIQLKLTLFFATFSILLISVAYIFINIDIRLNFDNFAKEKQKENIQAILNQLPIEEQKIFLERPENRQNQDTLAVMFRKFPPNSPEYRFLESVKITLIKIAIISIIFSFFIGYLVSRIILGRIVKLNDSIKKYSDNQTAISIQSDTQDEIGDLINSYNELILKINRQELIRKEFFIDMSHEIRTPLTAIKGYLEGLIDKVFEPKEEIFRKALNETDRLSHLTKEMTNLAKIEASKNPLNMSQTDIHVLVNNVKDLLIDSLTKKNLNLEIIGALTIPLDSDKFKQVIINLLSNAISYSPLNTTINIEIGTSKKSILKFKNIGLNINEKELPFLFERFYRNDKSRVFDENKQHLGIGLSIVQKIVNDHGFSIKAYLDGEYIVFEIFS